MTKGYKDTMNLPKTDFPMRGNLAQNEPKRLDFWEENDLYNKILEKNKEGEPFVLHDGPPYANGPIHLGHAFNKILKDFVIKSHSQMGFYTPFVPGWDCHGQPIEHMVEQKLGPEKMSKIDKPTIRRLCREWAEKFVNTQRDGFKRLGVNADWEHPYLTFTPTYESGNVEVFKQMYLDGAIYQGSKPIHWCKHCHTALAEAEIEYADEPSASIFVRFLMDGKPDVFKSALNKYASDEDLYILIWTTTPWTLPANTAVSLAPNAQYCVVRAQEHCQIMAFDMICDVANNCEWDNVEVLTETGFVNFDLETKALDGSPILVLGKELEGQKYTCPIRQDLKGMVIWGDHVTLDSGTGCVHTAPGHGVDDYIVGQKFGVASLMPVDDNGVLTDEAGRFAGLDVDEANPKIIEWLKEQGVLSAKQDIVHSYPHCWRCHEPVIFRATKQWFVSMDKTGLRKLGTNAVYNDVEFIPNWAKNRIGSMIQDRPDWCISRQRNWGVPIPVFKCKKCGTIKADEKSFDSVIKLFNEHGADAWYTKDPSEYLPSDITCDNCGECDFEAESDILDVWWESGVSHTSVLKHRESEGLHFPAEMYLEGSDQHRGWFQSSLLTSLGAYGVPPYKQVMHCGFIVDGDGRKMSKSRGNVIDPADVCNKYGADVLRLWVSSVDYSVDVSINDEILQRITEAYRRIRNTFRYLLANLGDFDPKSDIVDDFDNLKPVDRWMLALTVKLCQEVKQNFKNYNFHAIYKKVYNFINNELSSVYMNVTKDRLYSDLAKSNNRKCVQTVLWNILEILTRILSPILSFTCDEVWEHYPESVRNSQNRPVSVQLAGWPDTSSVTPTVTEEKLDKAISDFDIALKIRDEATKALELAVVEGDIKKSQEARVTIQLSNDLKDALNLISKDDLKELLILSDVEVNFCDGESVVKADIDKAFGEKCPRCWNYEQLLDDGLCARCHDVVNNL